MVKNIIIILLHIFASVVYSQNLTKENIEEKNSETKPTTQIEEKSETKTDKPIEEKQEVKTEKPIEVKPVQPKPEFAVNQFIANDVNFRGISIYGEKLSRRNLQEYQSFSNAWLVSTNVTFQLPLTGLKFLFTSNNPIQNRADKDSDLRLQTGSGGDDQTANVNKFFQTGTLNYDAWAVKTRKEKNGLRDVFIGQMYYDWETKLGGFRAGFFLLNNQNYPAKFNLAEWVLGYRPTILAKYINPEITSFYRFSSELNGVNNGNIHLRGSIKHEFFKDSFFRITPILEVGYQAANNSIDRRNGFSDVTAKLQFFLGNFFLGLNGIYRPNIYMYDNDRNFPKTGVYGDIKDSDEKTVDPSKTAGIQNRIVLEAISGSGYHEVIRQYLINKYQQQDIVQNIYIVNIGYSLKF